MLSVHHGCCQPGPAPAGTLWVLQAWRQCCGWARVLRAWHGCCEPGTSAAGLAQALQAWHRCCEPGVGAGRLAGAPRAWHGPPAPRGSSSLAGGAKRLRTPRVRVRGLWPDPPPPGDSAREAFPYITRHRAEPHGAAPASVSPRRDVTVTAATAAAAMWMVSPPVGKCHPDATRPLCEVSSIPKKKKNHHLAGVSRKIRVIGAEKCKIHALPHKNRLTLHFLWLNPFSLRLGGG